MIDVEIEDEAWTASLPEVEAVVRTAAARALALAGGPDDAAVTVLLTDDEAVADLNQRYRVKPGPTNVLSFPAAPTARPHLGDIALAHGVCVREADAQGKPVADHLRHLVAHGVLHLLGYDHLSDEEAEDMEALERRILAELGAPDPYADRTA